MCLSLKDFNIFGASKRIHVLFLAFLRNVGFRKLSNYQDTRTDWHLQSFWLKYRYVQYVIERVLKLQWLKRWYNLASFKIQHLKWESTPNIYKRHHFGVNFDMIAYNSSVITLQYGWKDI